MSLYVRIYTSFYTSRKTAHLRALIGDDAYWVPPRIWAYAAENQPDGDMKKYPPQVLANLIGYTKDATSMHQALLDVEFFDPDWRIHDWHEHNGYHASYKQRAKKAASARYAKIEGGDDRRGDDKKRKEVSSATSIASSTAQAPNDEQWTESTSKARILLGYLSQKVGSRFMESASNLDPIAERIFEVQMDLEGCKRMIDRFVAMWKTNPIMSAQLRPDYLFGDKFHGFYGQRDMALPATNGAPTNNRNNGVTTNLAEQGRLIAEAVAAKQKARLAAMEAK